jgi:predicted RNA-binding protein with PUA-like domain
VKPLPSPVTLQEVKGEKSLEGISLIKQSRLSVMPIAPKEYERILGMGGI